MKYKIIITVESKEPIDATELTNVASIIGTLADRSLDGEHTTTVAAGMVKT